MSEVIPRNSPYAPVRVQPLHESKDKERSIVTTIPQRLEELREILRSESMSYGELAELQDLAPHIEAGDVELLEAAGVPEEVAYERSLLDAYFEEQRA